MRIPIQRKYGPARAWLFGIVALFALILAACANNAVARGEEGSADPQRLLIPRWFLFGMELEGQVFEIAEGQQSMTMQFKEDGSANGGGGCNNFFTNYEARQDGSMEFGPVGATKMFCEETMQHEIAYFEALARVEQFSFEDYRLVLSSTDGKTKLTFVMPPK